MKALISFEGVSHLIGVTLALLALGIVRDRSNPRRFTTALFWSLLAACLLFDQVGARLVGKPLTHQLIGGAVLLVALIAGLGGVGSGRAEPVDASVRAQPVGTRLFLPALAIPAVTIACALGLKGVSIGGVALFDGQPTLGALAAAAVVALGLACVVTRGAPSESLREGRRLLDNIGWVIVLPMMLAILGGVFAAARTGDSIKLLTLMIAPEHQRFLIVALYCVGMAGFTAIMGNAFAAFPVMTSGLALPLLVKGMGAAPAPLMAIGMCAGYCGTLLTPMAANFNIVPAALLELKDRYAVIKAQAPTAIGMLLVNILLMSFLAFR